MAEPELIVHQRERRRSRWWIAFWVASIGLHVGAAVALAVSPELRSWLFETRPAEFELSESEAARLARDLKASYAQRLADAVAELDRIDREIRAAGDKKRADYVSLHGEIKPDAAARLDWGGHTATAVPKPQAADAVLRTYTRATEAFGEAGRVYEKVRALDLADRQNVPMGEALDASLMQVPEQPTLDPAVFDKPITALGEDFEALKYELARAEAATDKMVAQAERWLLMSQGLIGEVVLVGGDSWVAALPPDGGGDDPLGQGPYVGPELLPHEMAESRATRFQRNPMQGRKLLKGRGLTQDFMNVDTWYIIGPFIHPGTDKLENTPYPPETLYAETGIVDLTATYINKKGEPMKWRWLQRPYGLWRMEPYADQVDKYAIWYAYTEVWADETMERYVLFGSDDYGRVWVNGGDPVWTSGEQPHAWIADRGIKPVTFRKGINRVLFKLENQGGTTGFSMIITAPEI